MKQAVNKIGMGFANKLRLSDKVPVFTLYRCAFVPLCLCAFVPLCLNNKTNNNST